MICVGYEILTADQDYRDDAGELFNRNFYGNRTIHHSSGIAAFNIRRSPNILKGEAFAEYQWIYENEEYVTRYGLYAFRMCIKYEVSPELFIVDGFDYRQVIKELTTRKYKLKEYVMATAKNTDGR